MAAADLDNFVPLLERIEQAVDAHKLLLRQHAGTAALEHASILVDRDGFTAGIKARLSRQRRMTTIYALGGTPEAAVDELIASLDRWAGVLR